MCSICLVSKDVGDKEEDDEDEDVERSAAVAAAAVIGVPRLLCVVSVLISDVFDVSVDIGAVVVVTFIDLYDQILM